MEQFSKELKDISEILMVVRLDIRELMTEVRSLKALQEKVVEHETKLAKIEDKVHAAHKRIDKIDKIFFWLVTTVFTAIILAVMALITIQK